MLYDLTFVCWHCRGIFLITMWYYLNEKIMSFYFVWISTLFHRRGNDMFLHSNQTLRCVLASMWWNSIFRLLYSSIPEWLSLHVEWHCAYVLRRYGRYVKYINSFKFILQTPLQSPEIHMLWKTPSWHIPCKLSHILSNQVSLIGSRLRWINIMIIGQALAVLRYSEEEDIHISSVSLDSSQKGLGIEP